jgi:hypothetical protein
MPAPLSDTIVMEGHMALGGFATGALVTAPVVAVLTWLTVTWQQHVDVRVERDTVVAHAERATFNAKFDDEWARLSGRPSTECNAVAVGEVARLRKRVGELEERLTATGEDMEGDKAALDVLVKGEAK